MKAESGTTRWWEYYLPRYLMPSIAGIVIVNWLCSYAPNGLRALLLLPSDGKISDWPSLILLLLYGNFFCYVASYPVLVFHATRVMDFRDATWPAYPVLDGYLLTTVLVGCIFSLHWVPAGCRYWPAYMVALVLAALQLGRLSIVWSHRFKIRGHASPVTRSYYYTYVLAHRRAEEQAKGGWHTEFVETYRHMREHGNSAFIFLLELVLAMLTYCVITKPDQSPTHQLGAVGLLFAIWSIPSIFVHLLAQLLERRFSRYDLKIRTGVFTD